MSDHPWQAGVAEEISRRGLELAQATTFISMAIKGESSQLAGVKAVTENYPLRGRLRIAPAPNAPDAPAQAGPARGTVWIEERLVSALAAPVGSTLKLGNATLKVAAIITLEPERGANFFNIAPRLFMNVADVAATGLVQTGSRVSYHLYAAGERKPVAALEAWAKGQIGRGQRVDNLESGRPEVRGAIERAQRFLGLTALLAAILAGVAIALGTRRFVERHLDGCAVMRCYGATQGKLLALFGMEFVLLGLVSCAAGARHRFRGAVLHRGNPQRAAARRPAGGVAAARGAGLPRRPGAAARLRAAAAGAAEERAGGARHPPRGRGDQGRHHRGLCGGRGRALRPAHLAGGRRADGRHRGRRFRRRGGICSR